MDIEGSDDGGSTGVASSMAIYGETDKGKPVTLWRAELGNWKSVSGRMQEEFWRSSWVCVGAHVPDEGTQVFKKVSIALDDLYYLTDDGRLGAPKWVKMEGVDHPGEEQENGTLLLPYVLPVIGGHRADHEKASIGDAVYSINTDATRPWISPATERWPQMKLDLMTDRLVGGLSLRVQVSAHASYRRESCSGFSAEEMLRAARPILGMASLATFKSSGVQWIRAVTIGGHEVSIFCRLGSRSRPDAPIDAGGPVFTLQDVPLQDFLDRWQHLNITSQAEYAWSVVVGLVGHSPLMVEEHVGQVLAAAEGFHRWCLKIGKADLRDRLKELYDRLSDKTKRLLSLDVDHWSDWAVWARNHVAHGGARVHRDVSDYYQLRLLSDSVRLVTYLVALQELGVANERIEEALVQHPRLRALAVKCLEVSSISSSPSQE
jgi:hypothetical protein